MFNWLLICYFNFNISNTTLTTVFVIISISKFLCFAFFSCNFFARIYENVLFFVRATYLVGTISVTSRFCFSINIALSVFSGDASRKYVIELATGQEENPFQVEPDEITEATPQELLVDKEGDSDIDID